MIDVDKRLVEVETILEKLETTYKNKIPKEIWEYIKQNKDSDYTFSYNDEEHLMNQSLNIDTVAILTYINMEYLLDKKQKQETTELLKKDEIFLEKKKREKYNPGDLFKNKNSKVEKAKETVAMVAYKESIFTRIKNWFKWTF